MFLLTFILFPKEPAILGAGFSEPGCVLTRSPTLELGESLSAHSNREVLSFDGVWSSHKVLHHHKAGQEVKHFPKLGPKSQQEILHEAARAAHVCVPTLFWCSRPCTRWW